MTNLFADEGGLIIAVDFKPKVMEKYKNKSNITPVICDVTKEKQVDIAKEKYGRLDVYVIAAGINNKVPYRSHEYPMEEWDALYNVLVRGAFLVMKYSLQLMLESGGRAIVHTGSIGAFRATPVSTAYCSAKGAIRMMTTNVAAWYVKDNIRINSVCPGIFDTAILNGLLQEQIKELSAQVAMGYIGKPIDMAYLTLFLASDESKYITGQSILIDGGRYVTSFFYL